jgi:ribosomal protein S18 acetylase RimI-like enzyme
VSPERPAVSVEEAHAVDDALVAAWERLIGQLSRSAPPPGRAELEEIVSSPATRLLLARNEEGEIVGSLTLALFRIPTGVRAWIEDVVVDEAARGQGAGVALTREALRVASEGGARTIDLTSRPDREAANRLYQAVGFERRETNVYRATPGA